MLHWCLVIILVPNKHVKHLIKKISKWLRK
ncbi:hypothetical protein LRATCC53608_pI162 (plasmid) [Limosilactobacillus reuteri subsp. suis]|uniref:Uncharacterized protein n=1 Tax=Limosilactobacillus reuteri subsp. suis (strain ATCC 53608 / LMG 31752 / 1063) TaxID=927703 RepID=F8KG98_LIMR5|nr:hypothetical protein LRATCC53608_1745 [Limosilactobacillus reuteri subsp. suis]CUU13574.1 hypothetical protein LRATCC53608_pI162 [Limosilactobacillus reuteri subsp. suis]